MSAQDEIYLTFPKSDQTLVENCTVALYFGSDICQTKLGFVQVNYKSARKSDVRLLFHALQCETLWSKPPTLSTELILLCTWMLRISSHWLCGFYVLCWIRIIVSSRFDNLCSLRIQWHTSHY